MDTSPLVSIVIPLYNVEALLPRCLDSVLAQTRQDWEVIGVDDGSVDGTAAVFERYVLADNRFRLVRHPENKGQMTARHTGCSLARGTWILFADGDDALRPRAVEVLLDAALAEGADIVTGGVDSVRDGKSDTRRFSNVLRYGNDRTGAFRAMLRGEITHSLWNKIYRASLFRDPEPRTWDHMTNAEDALLNYQLLGRITRIAAVPDIVYTYYHNPASSTGSGLSAAAVESHVFFQKQRLALLQDQPALRRDLYAAAVRDLCRLCILGSDRKTVNRLLGADFPLHLTVRDIVRYGNGRYRIKGVRQAYLSPLLKKWKQLFKTLER